MKNQQLPRPPVSYRITQALMWPVLKFTRMSCRDAFRLSAERMNGPLGFTDSIRLRFHLLSCRICRRLPRQFENLRHWLRLCHDEECGAADDNAKLPEESRQRICRHLEETARDQS